MISWLQTVIQRNHKILFGILLIVIIVAFVFTVGNFGGGPGPGLAPDERQQNFYGYDLSNPRVRNDLSRWTSLSLNLNGVPNPTQEQFTFAVLQRALGLHLAGELQLPDPTDREFARYMQRIPAFIDPQTGVFSANRSQEIIDSFNNDPQLGEGLLSLVLLQDYKIEKVVTLIGGPGYVLPELAKNVIAADKTQWTLEVATLSREGFDPKLDVSDPAIEAYYEANRERYRPQDKVIGGYVLFPVAKYLAEVGTPGAAQLESYYNANSTLWPKAGDGQPQPLQQIKDNVIAAWKETAALEKAESAANQLTLALYNAATAGRVQDDQQSVEAFLKGQNLELVALPPFNSTTLSQSANASQNLIKQRILALQSQDRFYSDAILLTDGAALGLAFGEEKSEVPALSAIREQVVADYTREQSALLFADKSKSIRDGIEKAIADGKSFSDAASGLGLTVRKIGPYSVSNPPQDINPYYLFASMELPQGGVSELLPDQEGSSIVYVAQKDVPEDAIDAAELDQAIANIGPRLQRLTVSSVLGNLINVGEPHSH